MSWSEVNAIIKADGIRSRESWEQTRRICYFSAAPHTKQFKKASDLFKFPWDEQEKKTKQAAKPLTPEEFKKLVEQVNIQDNDKK